MNLKTSHIPPYRAPITTTPTDQGPPTITDISVDAVTTPRETETLTPDDVGSLDEIIGEQPSTPQADGDSTPTAPTTPYPSTPVNTKVPHGLGSSRE